MGDLSGLYNVATNDNVIAADHNTLVTAVTNANADAIGFRFQAIGHIAAFGTTYDIDAIPIRHAFTITGLRLTCLTTPASGTITAELFKVTPGGAATTLYSSNPKPTLTCNGGYASATSSNLPNTVALTAGDLLICRFASTVILGAYDFMLQAY